MSTNQVSLSWIAGLRFRGGVAGRPAIEMDGDGATGPSPMDTLLLAAAGCTGADVVVILRKGRVALRELRIETLGARRETEPRRYVSIHLAYHLAGEGLDEPRARRAIDLSIEKYCSVMHSLASDIRITYDLHLA